MISAAEISDNPGRFVSSKISARLTIFYGHTLALNMGTVTLWTTGVFLIIALEMNMHLETACVDKALNYMHQTETRPLRFFEHLLVDFL